MVNNPDQEIVYRDQLRFDYRTLRERICRLANALTTLGVKPGDTVAVMDWDSHRYLECFFAIPMIGAVLHTINVRLSPDQILYTIDHAEDDVILVHSDFLPILEAIKGRIDTVHDYVLLTDDPVTPETQVPLCGEYEALLANASTAFDFPDLDEHTRATTFYTTGTTGMPKGVYFSHRQLVLHTLARPKITKQWLQFLLGCGLASCNRSWPVLPHWDKRWQSSTISVARVGTRVCGSRALSAEK